jgi:deoxyadenosine/deoxycytidine kinase
VYEPIDDWKYLSFREHTPNILKKFYQDPKTYAMSFQQMVMETYIPLHELEVPTTFKIMERSIHSSLVFRQVLLSNGLLTPVQNAALHNEYRDACSAKTEAELVLYLRTDPTRCYERLQTRHRPEEMEISHRYLSNLHEAHEEWISCAPFPVIYLNGELPSQEVLRDAITAIYRNFADSRIRRFAPHIENAQSL